MMERLIKADILPSLDFIDSSTCEKKKVYIYICVCVCVAEISSKLIDLICDKGANAVTVNG
jgi:hypothetical protein